MELKVWVDGIQRVVCGVSEQTTCQEVVIALAQAIGQTGRFVLVQRLREKERQMLPQECPVGAQATCGQFSSDVQFVLRRTGPSLAGRPSSDNCPPPERCPVRASLPVKPRPVLGQESCKAPAFGLGHPELAPRPIPPDPTATIEPVLGCSSDLQGLEWRVQRNAAELVQEAFWEQELRREQAREREGQAQLQALSAATSEHIAQLQALDAQARALEAELRLAGEAPGAPSPTVSAAGQLRQDLAAQERQSLEVQSSLALVSRALEAAEHTLQAQAQELEELNRELRQCNLQQFIQQAGAAPPPGPRPERTPPGTQDLLGAPRSPVLVTSLSPEVAPMRQNSWSRRPALPPALPGHGGARAVVQPRDRSAAVTRTVGLEQRSVRPHHPCPVDHRSPLRRVTSGVSPRPPAWGPARHLQPLREAVASGSQSNFCGGRGLPPPPAAPPPPSRP
ncbi:PREDICTED: ras association domain-containing protein 7 [Elephantulus edwardii]|uniref:ras association domain-containing protein 7 n=1 Tax=Elephantulus edwardii TaxID=28737 RepID=UPI0003F0BD77|nr:PREDICTED: ras association domain-containing protein 7 [Elephantulus edwardii]